MAQVDEEYVPTCCDPATRRAAGHHAPACTDLIGYFDDRELALTVGCPKPKGCGQPAGQRCVTEGGYGARTHRVRLVVARGGAVAPVRKDGRPSHSQADMLAAAAADGGIFLLCGYNFHGVPAQKRTMKALVDKGWMEFREYGQHEDRYELTNDGRNALARYREWMARAPRR